jgi:GNAT superfamily N-acetyltransferase
MSDASADVTIEPATLEHVPLILDFIRKLAEYEKLSHEVAADEEVLRESLFGTEAAAEVLLAYRKGAPVGFAVYFKTFSTFLGQPGIYLEDLFVEPESRGLGIGKALLGRLAKIAVQRGYRRMNWSVLTWNQPSIEFYQRLGAVPLRDWMGFRLTGDALKKLAEVE